MAPWIEIALRTFLIIIIIFLLAKILGKKQLGKLSYFDFITGIAIGVIAALVIFGDRRDWYLGLIPIIIWAGLVLAFEYLSLKSKIVRDFAKGKSEILIKDGKILEDNLKKERLTGEDLLAKLRAKNAFELADVEFAVLETDGELNVLPKSEQKPLTPKSMGMKVVNEQEPQTVIIDGEIMDEPLATLGLNRGWLITELEKIGVSIENVFLGQVDSLGQLTIDCFDDQLILPEPQEKPKLLAILKKCKADIETFALRSEEDNVKTMYENCSKKLEKVISSVNPILKK